MRNILKTTMTVEIKSNISPDQLDSMVIDIKHEVLRLQRLQKENDSFEDFIAEVRLMEIVRMCNMSFWSFWRENFSDKKDLKQRIEAPHGNK